MSDLIGTQLGQYRLIEVSGRGGMSTIYKAYQPNLDRYVAVKVLQHNRDPQFAARFKREARAIAQLQHSNILPIYDYGEQGNLLYLVLQYIENGVTLDDMLGKPMAPVQALRLAGHLLGALDYAHRHGIIHRDIKPGNVLMPTPYWPMLADFGIAKLVNDTGQILTVPGLIVGTATYMAPEQVLGRPIDGRTDLYSTGVLLYEIVTGRIPFDGETPITVMTRQAYEAPPPPRNFNPDLSPLVEAVLLRAMAKDPNERYQSAAEMAADLERVVGKLQKPHVRSRITGLYQVGVQAFEEGRWSLAVERLSKLVEIDSGYEDALELLEAARDAQERTKQEAQQQIELVRQRGESRSQQPPKPSSAPVTAPIDPRATHKFASLTQQLPSSVPAAAPRTATPQEGDTIIRPAAPRTATPQEGNTTIMPAAAPPAAAPQDPETLIMPAVTPPAAAPHGPFATARLMDAITPALRSRRWQVVGVIVAAVVVILLLVLSLIGFLSR